MKFFESEQKSRTKSCKKYPFRSKLIHDHADFDVTTYLALAKQWKSFAKLNLCAKPGRFKLHRHPGSIMPSYSATKTLEAVSLGTKIM